MFGFREFITNWHNWAQNAQQQQPLPMMGQQPQPYPLPIAAGGQLWQAYPQLLQWLLEFISRFRQPRQQQPLPPAPTDQQGGAVEARALPIAEFKWPRRL